MELVQAYIDKQFGIYVRELRNKADMTLKELADKIGISYTMLSKIENGQAHAKAEIVINIATLFWLDESETLANAGYVDKEAFSNVSLHVKVETDEQQKEGLKWIKGDEIHYEWLKFIDEMEDRCITPDVLRELLRETDHITNKMVRLSQSLGNRRIIETKKEDN